MENRNEIRARIFQSLFQAWTVANYLGYTRISPGAGKSKMMIDIIKWHINTTPDVRVLILVPNEVLRDKTFIDEIKLWWNLDEFNKYCVISCYQSQYKISGEHYTLGLFDEGDKLLSEKLLLGYTNNTYDKALCLSGTFAKEKREKADEVFGKILLDYPVSRAQQEGLINKTRIHVVPVPLDTNNTVAKTNGFWSEASAYKWIDESITKYRETSFNIWNQIEALNTKKLTYLEKISQGDRKPEHVEFITSVDTLIGEHKKKWKKAFEQKKRFEYGYGFKYARTNFTYSLASLTTAAKKLKEKLLEGPDNKLLVFAKRTNDIDKITKEVFYKDKGDGNIERFNQGDIRELGLCKRNRGINYSGLDNIIFHSYDSSEAEATQAITRAVRLPVDRVADIYFLVSYYGTIGIRKDGPREQILNKCRNYVWFSNIMNSLGMKYDIVSI